MAKRNRIYLLCGFMGSGKTTLLQRMAKEGLKTIDLDDLILSKVSGHNSLGDFIRSVGWDEFRNLEQSTLQELVDGSDEELLVALGGGTLDRLENRSFVKNHSHVSLVWLHLDFEKCLERIQGDKNRPQLDKSIEDLQQLYASRVSYFEEADARLELSDIEAIKNWSDFKRKLD